LKIDLIGAGHCNEKYAKKVGDTIVLGGGSSLSSYAFATFEYDFQARKIVSSSFGTQENEGGTEDPAVAAIVSRWQAKTDSELNQPIGYLANTIPRQSIAMQDLTTGAWLWANPVADIALTNLGGMRDDLPAGKLTKANIVNIMPFNNVLVQLRLNGSQILQVIAAGKTSIAIGGIHKEGSDWVLNKNGLKLNGAGTFTVLVNDFMYAGGDNYSSLVKFDPDGYNTSVDWRQPVIDWIKAQNSTPNYPLDKAISGLVH
jgi:5'-nucleotidase/UDP-sugar diphosphatase